MTHNHALDLELSAALLKRNDFTYFGLIGSKTKRVKFEHRLRDRGISASHLQRMRCPMGLSEVKGKLPVEIAISIAGEIIATYNTHFGQHTACADSASSESIKQLLPSSRRSHATH
jgi:xanthine dehydrogenase accessory factor